MKKMLVLMILVSVMNPAWSGYEKNDVYNGETYLSREGGIQGGGGGKPKIKLHKDDGETYWPVMPSEYIGILSGEYDYFESEEDGFWI